MKKQQCTRIQLKTSVKDMLKQNPMQVISIKSISVASRISRTSFYANFENMADLVYELHDDFISEIGNIYRMDTNAAYCAVSQSTLMMASEYIQKNKTLIQFLFHEEGADLFLKRTYQCSVKLITAYFTKNGIEISDQKKEQLKIVILGFTYALIYQDLPECKIEDIYMTLKNAYSLFFALVLDKGL